MHNVALFSLGSIFMALGFVLLNKVWWKISFNLPVDVNVAPYLAFILLSAVLVWIGMGFIAVAFRLI